MKELLIVLENESIICKEEFKEIPSYKYLKSEIFEELSAFVLENSNSNENDAIDFLKLSQKRNVGKIIQVKNYVGVIQLKSGFQIQVLPKIHNANIDDTQRLFLNMLRTLRDFPGKIFNKASLNIDRMNLYEVFINMYIQEVRHLVKRGIKSGYVDNEENLRYFKGKLLTKEQIKSNYAHKERFYLRFEEFSSNRSENKIVKSTLLKLSNITESYENGKEIRQLLSHFELVEPSSNFVSDFSKIVIDRSTIEYDILMQWSKVFLLNKSFTTFTGETVAHALLFPMEKIFESFVTQKIKKHFFESHWEVSAQDKGYYLFDTPSKFSLRPDLVISSNSSRKIILDCKWKLLTNNPQSNYGISQSDMYQMYAYGKKYETSEVWLLYPKYLETEDIGNVSYVSKDYVTVNLFFIDLANIDNCILELKDRLTNQT